MRIVIDMQGTQTGTRFRGIGRHMLAFAQAVARNRGEHEVILALSGLFPDTIEPIRAAFDGLLPQESILLWFAPGPVMEESPGNAGRRETAELIREAFLASLAPDVIHVSSLFEGYVDDAVTSIGRFDRTTLVSVALYERPDPHIQSDPRYAEYCKRKLEYLKHPAVVLAIAECASDEDLAHLGVPEDRILDISTALEAPCQLLRIDDAADISSMPDEVAHAREDDAWRTAMNESATRAIAAWDALIRSHLQPKPVSRGRSKPRLALVSPLPPERTGIADYSAELVPALAEHYEIEVVVAQDKIAVPWLEGKCTVRDVSWLRAHAHEMDRVVYQIGNSPFHQHMLPLLEEIPGTVVLHDFYLSGLISWLETVAGADRAWVQSLYVAHGYGAVRERYLRGEAAQRNYPANFRVLQHAQGIIVHSEYSRKLAQQWYGDKFSAAWEVVPLVRASSGEPDRAAARRELGIGEADFVVCSFGFLGWTKLNSRLLGAWLRSSLASDEKCHLVFVGENQASDYGARLVETIKASGHDARIRITGFASLEVFQRYLASADMAVQLRTHSRGETSAAALDCMNFALPLIVNANGSMAELDPRAVWLLPDEFDERSLIEALETLWQEPQRRRTLGEHAREIIRSRHSPRECARRYASAIDAFHRRAQTATPALTRAIAAQNQFVPNDAELRSVSNAIAVTLPLKSPAKRLFLDISATRRNDLKTGIERVARALLLALLQDAPAGYRVEPVYLSDAHGRWHYRFARRYALGLLGVPKGALDDEIAEPECGDELLALDLSGDTLVQAARAGLFADYRNRGCAIHAVVFDLLPVRMPDVFPPGTEEAHARWLSAVSRFDGALCISKAVADDLAAWHAETGLDRKEGRPFRIGWFPLGADLANTSPSRGVSGDCEWVLRQLLLRPSFLMVGTIEPRKGYLQAIDAFNTLWAEGIDVNLVIVGTEGWKGLPDEMRRDIPRTLECLRSHPERQRRLFWLEGISDEYLEKVYAASTCLIAASFGEGFGLPLIEAAQHGLPILARDIPVFREVAGENAFYFNAPDGAKLANAIKDWLVLLSKKAIPPSDRLEIITWKQSAARLMQLTINRQRLLTGETEGEDIL